MVTVETYKWTTKILYDSLLELEDQKINLRGVLNEIAPLGFHSIHIHDSSEIIPKEILKIGTEANEAFRRYENLTFDKTNVDEMRNSVQEYLKKSELLDEEYGPLIFDKYGMHGELDVGVDRIIISFDNEGALISPKSIEALLIHDMIDFLPGFSSQNFNEFKRVRSTINTTRINEDFPEIYQVHTPILLPGFIDQSIEDSKERIRLYPDAWEKFMKSRKMTDTIVSEEYPRLVNAMFANLV